MGGKNYTTLTAWLATRKDSSSISMDPVFHDIANGDLTPTKIPFENRGSNVGISKDIQDVSRNTASPDIGAFEFTICRNLTAPVLKTEETGVNTIRFGWQAVQYTSGYRVSRDGGATWTIPSSGAMGTTHTITGLHPSDTVGLMVKALGSRVDCPEYYSQRLIGKALADGIFVPNTFTPNGNGQNDVFRVYSNVMKSVRWMVFNQWGEKVFETTEIQGTWDGNYKGKPQPVGVYVYVVAANLVDGTKVTQKGSFNLVR
jgi:gliding motility-associated-like protein